jgi:hypothetical protein
MTREEIKNIPELVDLMLDNCVLADTRANVRKRLKEVCDLAIKALEQEPSKDTISRQAALGCCRNECEDIAKAFQFGLALGFGKKYDEMDRVIDEIKKVIKPQENCDTCKHKDDGWDSEHCDGCCGNHSGFEPQESEEA